MATEDYVPIAADDWYQRRRSDAEGEFFRSVAKQGPRKDEGGSTQQGIYCLTADGKLLAYKNAGQAPDVMREVLRQGLKEWKRLPAERRNPGAVTVEPLDKTDANFSRKPPEGGLIVRVYTRILERDGAAQWKRGSCTVAGADKAARDHLWLTANEWKALIPSKLTEGEQTPLPPAVVDRILRFHLTDNTRGEPPMWRREDVRAHNLKMTVDRVTPEEVSFRLTGSALLATGSDAAKAARGFDVHLVGKLQYDRVKRVITRFDVVAVGDHWGEGPYTRQARPGRQPLGVAFELVNKPNDADLVPPQAAREIGAYFGRY